MDIKKATLKYFDEINYTATIEINGSSRSYLENIRVASNLIAAEMIVERNLAVLFFDTHNAKEAVIIAVYP